MERPHPIFQDNINGPLYEVIGRVAALWTVAMLGFYLILPIFGIEASYNAEPVALGFYFLVWIVASMLFFRDLFLRWLVVDRKIWLIGAQSMLFGAVVWSLLYALSELPALDGTLMASYAGLLPEHSWYFFPKSAEVLVQQLLIAATVLALYFRFHSLKRVMVWYLFTFGGAHIALFALNGSPTPYALTMTLGAVFSTLIFPYLILKMRGGFLYSYAIHLGFYLAAAILLRTWPF